MNNSPQTYKNFLPNELQALADVTYKGLGKDEIPGAMLGLIADCPEEELLRHNVDWQILDGKLRKLSSQEEFELYYFVEKIEVSLPPSEISR